MEKESLLKLHGEMQIGQSVGDSGHDSSWFAFRKAESITDSGVLPLLRELIE